MCTMLDYERNVNYVHFFAFRKFHGELTPVDKKKKKRHKYFTMAADHWHLKSMRKYGEMLFSNELYKMDVKNQ